MVPRTHNSLLLLLTLGLLLIPTNSGPVAAQAEADFESIVGGTILTDATPTDLSHVRREGSYEGIGVSFVARRGGASTDAVFCTVEIDPADPVRYRIRESVAQGRGFILANPVTAAGQDCVVSIVDGVEDSHHPWPNNHSPGQFHREGTIARVELKIRVQAAAGGFDHHYCIRGFLSAIPSSRTTAELLGEVRGDVVDRGPDGRCPEHELRRDLPPEWFDRFHG